VAAPSLFDDDARPTDRAADTSSPFDESAFDSDSSGLDPFASSPPLESSPGSSSYSRSDRPDLSTNRFVYATLTQSFSSSDESVGGYVSGVAGPK
jgi:hypothetical protein